jgi:hypothetical protein
MIRSVDLLCFPPSSSSTVPSTVVVVFAFTDSKIVYTGFEIMLLVLIGFILTTIFLLLYSLTNFTSSV